MTGINRRPTHPSKPKAYIMKDLLIFAFFGLIVMAFGIWWTWKNGEDARWEAAKKEPQWEPSETTFSDGDTAVKVVLVARYKNNEWYYKSTEIGMTDFTEPEWRTELEILRSKAKTLADALNESRNKGFES